MSQQTTIIEKETVTVGQPQVASTTFVGTDEGVHHTVGKSHTKEIVAGVAGAAGLVGVGLAARHRHHKYRGSSSSSSESASPVKKSHKRGAGLKLAGAVGQYLLRKKLANRHNEKIAESTTTGPSVGEKIAAKVHRHRSDSSSSSSDEEGGHKGSAIQAAMLAAVAKKLAERKFKHHRERNVVGTTAGLSTTDKIKSKLHRDSSLSSDEEVTTSHKNKALVKTVALTVLPLIKNQIREYTAKQGTNVELSKEGKHPLLDNNYIKAVAAVAQNFISTQAVGGNVAHGHHHHAHSSDEEVVEGKPTLKGRAAKAAAGLAARHLIKRKLNLRKHRTLTAHGVKSTSYRHRDVSVSSSSSSSSSDDEHGSKLKKAGLTAVAAGVAVNLVTKLNRRRERKAVRRAVVVETNPSKLEQLKLRLANLRSHSSSSSSSSSDEEVRTRKAGLHTAATAAAARLLKYRAEHRRPQLTETQYTTEINNIQPTLQSVEPVVFTDVETTTGLRNRASVIAGRRYVQRVVGRTYRQAHPRKVVLREGETLETHKRNKRHVALKGAAAWALRHYANKKARSHVVHTHTTTTVPVTTGTTVVGGETHVSKAEALKGRLHRHRSVSSSSSSSSSDEESHKTRKVAATLAAARIATNAVRKLRRRQERKTIRREVVVEKDQSKLAGLKTRLASLRARSSSSSSSSDEETHKKKTLLVAASTAAAAALLKKRYDHRRPKYTETVYTEKVGGINNRLNRLDTSVEVSSDEEYGRHLGRTSVLHRGARLFNRHTRRHYRQANPVTTTTTVGRNHPRAWVKLGSGVAISLLRESLRKRHYRQGYVQDLGTGVHGTHGTTTTTTSYSTAPVVGSTSYTSGVNTGLVGGTTGLTTGTHHHTGLTSDTHHHSGLTSGIVGGTTAGLVGSNLHHGTDYNSGVTTGTVGHGLVDEKAIYKPTGGIATTGVTSTGYTDSSYTSTGYTSGVTSGYASGLSRGHELIDANVRVKRHGLTHLTYEDLGFFVTLRVEHDYLINQGHIKAGDKVKALLGLRDDKVFSLDRIIDDQTKLLIKESLGLSPLDDIKLEYVGDQVDAGYGYGQSTGYGQTTGYGQSTGYGHGVGTTTGLATGGILGSELGHHHHTSGLTSGTTGLTSGTTGLTSGLTSGLTGTGLGHGVGTTGLTGTGLGHGVGTTGLTSGLIGTGLGHGVGTTGLTGTGLGHGVGTTGLTGTGLGHGLGHNNDYYDDDYENNYVTPSQARVANLSKMDRLKAKLGKHTRHGHPGLGATGYGTTLPTTTGVATGIPAGGLINPTHNL